MSEKKQEKKAAPKKEAKIKVPKANSELFMVGKELELEGEKFLVKEIKGIDVVLSRKDYK